MKFSLLKHEDVNLERCLEHPFEINVEYVLKKVTNFRGINLNSFEKMQLEFFKDEFQKFYRGTFVNLYSKITPEDDMMLYLKMENSPFCGFPHKDAKWQIQIRPGNFLQALQDFLDENGGSSRAVLKLVFKLFCYIPGEQVYSTIFVGNDLKCEGKSSLFSQSNISQLRAPTFPEHADQKPSFFFTLDVKIEDYISLAPFSIVPTPSNERMLRADNFFDVSVVSTKGEKVKCHKTFLGKVPALFTQLQTKGYRDSEGDHVNVNIESRNALNAFIRFIYSGNLEAPLGSSEIAFQLLEAANYYVYYDLWISTMYILLTKPLEWFEVEPTLKIFEFLKGSTIGDDESTELKNKLTYVLKLKETEREASPLFLQMFPKDSAAKEVLLTCLANLKD